MRIKIQTTAGLVFSILFLMFTKAVSAETDKKTPLAREVSSNIVAVSTSVPTGKKLKSGGMFGIMKSNKPLEAPLKKDKKTSDPKPIKATTTKKIPLPSDLVKEKLALDEKIEKYLYSARSFYLAGEFDNAVEELKLGLEEDPQAPALIDFFNKIKDVREGMAYVKTSIAKEHFQNVQNYIGKGLILEALIELKITTEIIPDYPGAAAYYNLLVESEDNLENRVSPGERDTFKKAVDLLLAGDFEGAANVSAKLEDGTQWKKALQSAVVGHALDRNSSLRSNIYLKDAQESIKSERFNKAQEYLALALEMNKNNLEARLMMVQVNLELALSDFKE